MTALEEAQQLEPAADRAFHVERHGIDHIPESERWGRPRDLFGMWAGASFQVENFVYGVILMTFGVSFAQAVWLTIAGNLSFFLLGLTSLQGPGTGTTVFTINRASYGPNGSRVLALFNWLTMVGFETEGLVLVVFAAEALALRAGVHAGTPLKAALVVLAGLVQLSLPLLGHATIVRALRYLVLPFFALYFVLALLTLGHADLGVARHGAGWETCMAALAFTIVLSGLGWSECGNDYSRYLPPTASKRAIVGWVFLGTAVPETLLMLLGCAVGSYTGTALAGGDPFAAFSNPRVHVFAAAFVVPFLVLAIAQLFAVNSLDLYSSGVTLQALGLRVARWQAVLVDTVICVTVTSYAIFDSSFSTLLKDFVDLTVIWIAPWLAIFLTDWVLRRCRYDALELQRTDRGSRYWGSGGIRWPGLIAQLLGMAASIEALSATFAMPPWLHYLNFRLGGSAPGYGADFSVAAGMVVGGLSYFLLGARSLRRERAA